MKEEKMIKKISLKKPLKHIVNDLKIIGKKAINISVKKIIKKCHKCPLIIKLTFVAHCSCVKYPP